jgi:O-antigen/teichoic acid export membrane protein
MAGRLGRNVAANIWNVATGIALALVSTPLILSAVGKAGFGVWSIALAFLLYLTIAEAGFAPAVQRFVATSQGRRDTTGAARILWSTLLLYGFVGVVAMVALVALAEPLAAVFDLSDPLRRDAAALFRLVGFTLPLVLLGAGLGNVLAGLERFLAVAVSAVAGSIAYLIAIALLVATDAELPALGWALVLQQIATALVRAVALRDVMRIGGRTLLSRGEWRAILAFAAKLQASMLSLLINGQSDRVVVGLVASASTVGQMGIAAQVAEAGRLLGGGALAPVVTRLSSIHGAGDPDTLNAEFARLNRLWLLITLGATAVALGALDPLITGWLGDGYGEAVLFGEFLLVAYGLNVLTGTRVAYLRAIDEVWPEAAYGGLVIALNVGFTVPLAVLFGAVGVPAGTLAAYVGGTIWFFLRFNRYAPPLPPLPLRQVGRAAVVALASAVGAFSWGSLMVELLPTGLALFPVALGAVIAFAGYVAAVAGLPPSPARIRALMTND